VTPTFPQVIFNGCLIIWMASLMIRGQYLWMFAVTFALLYSIPCLVSMECSATADCWCLSLVSLMCSEDLVEMWWSVCPMYTFSQEQILYIHYSLATET